MKKTLEKLYTLNNSTLPSENEKSGVVDLIGETRTITLIKRRLHIKRSYQKFGINPYCAGGRHYSGTIGFESGKTKTV